MKIASCLLVSVMSKSLTQVVDDLTLVTTRLTEFTKERGANSLSEDLTKEIVAFQNDVLNTNSTMKAMKQILAKGAEINLKVVLSTILPPDVAERAYGETNAANKFSLYGCYCSPHHDTMKDGFWLGKGTPVDDIDNFCKNLWSGYKCLKRDYGSDCDQTRTYSWKISDKGKPTCLESKGTCLGDLCRLDLEFAYAIDKVRDTWNPDYHINNGFDRFAVCGSQNPDKYPKENTSNYGGMKQRQCCGKGLGRHTFNPTKLECCKDGTTKNIGTCYNY